MKRKVRREKNTQKRVDNDAMIMMINIQLTVIHERFFDNFLAFLAQLVRVFTRFDSWMDDDFNLAFS